MRTEDTMGRGLRRGELTVDDVIAAFQADDVAVTPVTAAPEGETWQSVEETGAGSQLFGDLMNAGATAEQQATIATEIERARTEGRTMDKVFGWPS
jgi:hypothetical protein